MKNLEITEKPYIFILPAAVIIGLITMVPFVFLIYYSFHDYALTGFYPAHFIGVENYIRFFTDSSFLNAAKLTAVYIGTSLGVESVLGFFLACLLSRRERFLGIFRTIFIIPMAVSPAIISLIFRFLYNSEYGVLTYYARALGLLSTRQAFIAGRGELAMLSIILVDVWQWTPFVIILFLAGLSQVPKNLYEAAMTDGASTMQRFWAITLPIMKPIIVIVLLLRLLDLFRQVEYVYIITYGGPAGEKTTILSFLIYLVSFKYFDIGYGAAMSIILLLVALSTCSMFIKFSKLEI